MPLPFGPRKRVQSLFFPDDGGAADVRTGASSAVSKSKAARGRDIGHLGRSE
jgi:hypothetical protein